MWAVFRSCPEDLFLRKGIVSRLFPKIVFANMSPAVKWLNLEEGNLKVSVKKFSPFSEREIAI